MTPDDSSTTWQKPRCCGPAEVTFVLFERGDIRNGYWWKSKSWGWDAVPTGRTVCTRAQAGESEHSCNTTESGRLGKRVGVRAWSEMEPGVSGSQVKPVNCYGFSRCWFILRSMLIPCKFHQQEKRPDRIWDLRTTDLNREASHRLPLPGDKGL